MKKPKRYSAEWRDQAVRMVREHQTEYPSQQKAIAAVALRLSCSRARLRNWVRKVEDDVRRARLAAYERRRLKDLERENRELRSANDLVRKTAAFFAQAVLDRAPWEPQLRKKRQATDVPTECGPQASGDPQAAGDAQPCVDFQAGGDPQGGGDHQLTGDQQSVGDHQLVGDQQPGGDRQLVASDRREPSS